MQKRLLSFAATAVLIANVFVANISAQENPPLKNDKSNAVVVHRINGATEAIYSASGKFLAIQSGSKFFLLPTENLSETIQNLEKSRARDGQIVGFLPSETLLYWHQNKIFALDPSASTERVLFSGNAAKLLSEQSLDAKEIVVVSDDLIVSGDGNYDWGADKGNIFKFDLKRKRFSRGAPIHAFWYASPSPSRRYVLYEHGAEDNNNSDLYDIAQNKNYPLAEFFNFKKEFPKYDATDEKPVAWIGADKFLAEVSGNGDGVENDGTFLVLFDAAAKKIVWKKPVERWLFPTAFQQLSADKALVNYENKVYELSLKDGKMAKISAVEGSSIAISPDKKRIAFFNSNQLFVAAISGDDKKSILELPAGWKHQEAYKAMGERTPLWSADGGSLILFGEKEMLFVKIE